jgi:hypothetical protein
MRIPKFLAALAVSAALLGGGHESTASTGSAATAPSPVEYSAYVAHFGGFAAVSVSAAPGSTVDVWAIAPTGELLLAGQASVGASGTSTFVAPDLGAGFLVDSAVRGVDIRDWLE